jgi:copper(I)-binding protein
VNRALRAAAIGVLLIGPVALSACSGGQVNQTASQVRDTVGATVQVGNLTLRGIELGYPSSGSYAAGDDAVLNGAIVNGGDTADTLVSITGDGFAGVTVTGTGAQATTTPGSTAATSSAASTAGATTASSTATAAPTSGAAATTTSGAATTTTSGAAATTTGPTSAALPSQPPTHDVGIQIPAASAIFLGQNSPHVTLAGLTRSLNAAQSLMLTFTFQRAGAVAVPVLIAPAPSPVPPSTTFNFGGPTGAAGSNG